MMEASELIERLEKATGGSFDLDKPILMHFGARYDTDWDHEFWFGNERLYKYEVTRSLDAALALVERVLPGWDICIVRVKPELVAAQWSADIGEPETFRADTGLAPTPALALCLALLRASPTEEPALPPQAQAAQETQPQE